MTGQEGNYLRMIYILSAKLITALSGHYIVTVVHQGLFFLGNWKWPGGIEWMNK